MDKEVASNDPNCVRAHEPAQRYYQLAVEMRRISGKARSRSWWFLFGVIANLTILGCTFVNYLGINDGQAYIGQAEARIREQKRQQNLNVLALYKVRLRVNELATALGPEAEEFVTPVVSEKITPKEPDSSKEAVPAASAFENLGWEILDLLELPDASLDGLPTQALIVERAALRFTLLGVITLLVTILFGCFRYYQRLADHWDSCAYAIELAEPGHSDALRGLLEVLRPSVGFGKMPPAVLGKLADLVTQSPRAQ